MPTTTTILITGASKGIGRATAERLAVQGHAILGLARTDPGADFPGTFVACDLARAEATDAALAWIAARFAVDGIVNNVGIASPQPLGRVGLDTLSAVLDLNVRAAVQVTQAFVAGMRARRWGRIVNVCSRAIHGARDRTAYAAAKSALVGCTRTWALELAEDGVTCNAVAPGPIETALFRATRPAGGEAERRIVAGIPMRRLGTPEEVAAAIGFLISAEAGFITGQVLAVDGGGSLGGR
jgi:3-oxoacyl-[acyl-carrier protein] reductase